MELFTKLALVSAITMSANAMAMQSMDDEALGDTTGQDGITLTIKTDTGISIDKILLHDNDGLPDTTLGGTGTAGALILNNLSIAVDAANASSALGTALAVVNIDTDGSTSDEPFLNIGINLNATTIGIDGIAVAKSNDESAIVGARRGAGAETEILGALTLNMGASNLNIQLGAQPQGAMIVADATIGGGISLSGLEFKDAVNGGSIIIDNFKISSENSTDLNVNAKIGATVDGLTIQTTGATDLYMDSVYLGSKAAGSIGSVEVQGIDMGNSTIYVSGH